MPYSLWHFEWGSPLLLSLIIRLNLKNSKNSISFLFKKKARKKEIAFNNENDKNVINMFMYY
jgi:hypothetical protein